MELGTNSLRNRALLNTVQSLREQMAERLGLPTSGTKPTRIRFRGLPNRSIHSVASIEVSKNGGTVCCFAKSRAANYSGLQRLDKETHILRHVTSRIWQANPKARTPEVLAYRSEEHV